MKKIIMAAICIFILGTNMGSEYKAEELYSPPEKSKEELNQDIFISLLSSKIEECINNYYKDILSLNPAIYPYNVQVEKAERINGYRNFNFLVTVQVHPVIGPQNKIGLDRLTFDIEGGGDVELKKFEHIKDYELPTYWQHIIIKKS